jgi:GMP synthase (glutamine-hydrolysing)
MRVAIVENTQITHHGQVGVALHEAAAIIDLWKPWSDQRLPLFARPHPADGGLHSGR